MKKDLISYFIKIMSQRFTPSIRPPPGQKSAPPIFINSPDVDINKILAPSQMVQPTLPQYPPQSGINPSNISINPSNISINPSNISINPSEQIIEKKPLKPKPIRSYELVSIPQEEKLNPIKDPEFFKDPRFIKNYVKSIQIFLEFKIASYTKFLAQIKREVDKNKLKIEALKNQGFLPKEINKIIPNQADLVMEMVELINLLDHLKKLRQNTGEEKIKQNLEEAINHPEKGLAALRGHQEIKELVLNKIYSFAQNHQIFSANFNNILLKTEPNVGKTFLVKVLAFVFYKIGLLLKEDLNFCHGPPTKSKIINSLESLCLVEGVNSIEEIKEVTNLFDCFMGQIVIVLCINQDWSFQKRFPVVLTLKKYETKELADILIDLLPIELKKEKEDLIWSLIENSKDKFPGQAKDMVKIANHITDLIYLHKEEDLDNIILAGFLKFLD